MFGTPRRLQRPVLLIIVFGMFLAIVGVTAMAQIVMVSAQYSTSTMNSVVGTDAALVRMFVSSTLSPEDLDADGPGTARLATLEGRLATLIEAGEILQIEVRAPDGQVIASSQAAARGSVAPMSPAFESVLTGETASAAIAELSASEATGPVLTTPQVLREYFPLVIDGQVRAVVGIWRDAQPILAQIEDLRRNIVLVTLSAGLVAACFLYFVFRTAQSRISRQAEALVDAVQRDPLTGRLNHGAVVDAVALAVERSREDGRPFAIILYDIDNFRSLNDTYGHAAADDALLTVVEVLEREIPDPAVVGRYGPDELLVVVPTEVVHTIDVVLERVRASLVDHALQFDT
jgi:diguanylate cyclase (GGDEF)-like protein